MQTLSLRAVLVTAILLGVLADNRVTAQTTEDKVLDRTLGTWRAAYRIPKAELTPVEKQGSDEHVITRDLGGKFIVEQGKHSDGMTTTMLSTYDVERKSYRAWWFSSPGNTAEYTGKWDAATKTLTWTTIAGYPSPTTVTRRFVDDDTIDWEVVVKDGAGKVVFRMIGKDTRVKAGGEEKHALDTKVLQGTWVATRYEYDGKQVPVELIRKVSLRFTGDSFVMTEEGGDVSGDYQLGVNTKPTWVDVRLTSGENKGKTCHGRLELRDNMLIMCFRHSGGERPTEFDSAKGARLLHLKKRQP